MNRLAQVPDGADELLAIFRADHRHLAELTGLEFSAVEEEMGTRFETAIESSSGTVFVLVEPAYEPLGVNVQVRPGTELRSAEAEILDALGLEAADLAWRATALHLNEGDVVSIDPEAPTHYHPDAVGVVTDISYYDHPDLVPLPAVNAAVYTVRLEGAGFIEVPSNLVQWEPILHAESVRSAAGFANFAAALAHHVSVQSDHWSSDFSGADALARLITRLGERQAVAARARSQLEPTWGLLAALFLEVFAPPSWAEPDADD